MVESGKSLRKKGYDFKYQRQWGKAWSRLYIDLLTKSEILDDEELNKILDHLRLLSASLIPRLNKINWGRTRKKDVEQEDYGDSEAT